MQTTKTEIELDELRPVEAVSERENFENIFRSLKKIEEILKRLEQRMTDGGI